MTNFTWNGHTSNDFNTASNWSPSGVPGADDDPTIDVAGIVEVQIGNGGTNEVDSLFLNNGATLAIDTGDFIIDGGSNSVVGSDSMLQAETADLLVQGTIENVGTISLLSGADLQTSGSTLTLTAEGFFSGDVQLAGGAIGGRVAVGGTGTFDTLVLSGQTIDGFGSIGRNGFLDTLNVDLTGDDTIDADGSAARCCWRTISSTTKARCWPMAARWCSAAP